MYNVKIIMSYDSNMFRNVLYLILKEWIKMKYSPTNIHTFSILIAISDS